MRKNDNNWHPVRKYILFWFQTYRDQAKSEEAMVCHNDVQRPVTIIPTIFSKTHHHVLFHYKPPRH